MGIKEYRFLTRTMEEISSESKNLARSNEKLQNIESELSKMKIDSRDEWKQISKLSKRLETDKDELSEFKDEDTIKSLDKKISPLEKSRKEKNESIIRFWLRVPRKEEAFSVGPKLDTRGKIQEMNTGRNYLWRFLFYCLVGMIMMVVFVNANYTIQFCNDGGYVNPDYINDGEGDCVDGSDERVLTEAEEEWVSTELDNLWENFQKGLLAMTIIALLITERTKKFLLEELDEIVELEQQIEPLRTQLSTLLARKAESEKNHQDYSKGVKRIKEREKKNISLDGEIENKARHAKSIMKDNEILEGEIQTLWDSIAHLIPFSTALEKA